MQRDISADFPFSLKRAGVHDAEMAYADIGEGDPIVFLHGNPTFSRTWRNVIPHARGKRYSDLSAHLPMLFINAEEGHGTAGAACESCHAWPNQPEISLRVKHYLPEDCPPEIGETVARFVREVRSASWKADTAS